MRGTSANGIAGHVEEIGPGRRRVVVDLGERSCPVDIGPGVRRTLPDVVARVPGAMDRKLP